MTPFIRTRIQELNQAIAAFRQGDMKSSARIAGACHAAISEKLAPDAPRLGTTSKLERADAAARLNEAVAALAARGVDHQRALGLMSQVFPATSKPKQSPSKPAAEKPAPAETAEE